MKKNAAETGALRPAQRARCVRRRLRGQHQGPQVARHHPPGPADPGQSRPSRRRRRRPAGGRRRGLPDPDPRRPAARLGAQGGRRPAAARPLRRRHVLPAAGRGGARVRGQAARAFHQGRGPEAGRLARRADRHDRPRQGGDRAHAGDPPGDRRPRPQARRPGRLRAQDPGHPQADPEPAGRSGEEAQAARPDAALHAVLLDAHGGLQGPAAGAPGRELLRRSAQSADRVGARPGPPALLDQHLPVLEAGAPLPLHRPQRRDQHGARQRQLDERAPPHDGIRPARPRPRQDVAAHPARPVGHRLPRQRARAAGRRRLSARARHDDADPRGLGRQSADGCQAQGLLRISRRPDGAVGRPGRDRLHRRPPDRRHARPQRPAPGALHRHRRRSRGHGLGSRRAADPRGEDRAQVAPAARQDAADRPRAGPHHRGRGDQAHARRGRAPTRSG